MLPHPLFNFIESQIRAKINFIYTHAILLIDNNEYDYKCTCTYWYDNNTSAINLFM